MPEESSTARGLQWKWVWITLGMFVVLYLLPIIAASAIRGEMGTKLVGGWSFGGILIITAITGYLSRGITIWEPAVAGGMLTLLWYFGFQVAMTMKGIPLRFDPGQLLLIMIAVFGLSLVGAGLGEGIQNAAKKFKGSNAPSPTPD
ncbi:MAG: hypothetical protein WEB33_04055 [Bacteroidota bacterium]